MTKKALSSKYYNPAIAESMLNDIRLGLTLSDTAYRHRIPVGAVYNWYGSDLEGFKQDVDKAQVECKRLHLGRMLAKDASMVSVKASIFMLERKFRDEFGPTSQDYYSAKELQVFMLKVGNILTRHLADLSPEIVKSIAEEIEKIDVGRPIITSAISTKLPLGDIVDVEVEQQYDGEKDEV